MIKVLIVEDHLITRLGLKMVLEQWPTITIVGEAENGLTALQLVETLAPDLVLLDIGLPDIDGIECLARIKAKNLTARILMRSSHEEVPAIMAAMAAGADGYCFKDSSDAMLIEAIETMAAGKAWIHPRVASHLLSYFGTQSRQPVYSRNLSSVNLQSEEFTLLSAIARGDGKHNPDELQALMNKIGSSNNTASN